MSGICTQINTFLHYVDQIQAISSLYLNDFKLELFFSLIKNISYAMDTLDLVIMNSWSILSLAVDKKF